MRDWEGLVRTKLEGLILKPQEKRDVIAELAAHLEESCETLRVEGLPEREAIRQALSEISDWGDLANEICKAKRKEHSMNSRVKRFWLPGLLTFLISMSLLAAIEQFAPKLSARHTGGRAEFVRTMPSLLVYIPWLMLLPLIGAMGAHLSNRAGGSVRTVLASSIFPILPALASFAIMLPGAFLIDRQVGVNVVTPLFLRAVVEWALIPGTVLLVGGWLICVIFAVPLGAFNPAPK